MSDLKGWKELVPGGLIVEAGNAKKDKTGDWGTGKPGVNTGKSIYCFFFWGFFSGKGVRGGGEAGEKLGF